MKKALMTMVAAAVALGLCLSGCNKGGGDAKKDAGKTEAPAKAGEAAAPAAEAPAATSGAATFGDEICKLAMESPAKMMSLMSMRFITLLSLPEEQAKKMPKEQIEAIIKQAEENASKNMETGSTPEKDKATDCKVLDAKDAACDEIYTKVDTEGWMGQKPPAGRAKKIGDELKVESCGLVTMSATAAGKEDKMTWGVGKVNGKYAILTGFQAK